MCIPDALKGQSKEGAPSPETGVTGGYQLPCGCRELTSGLLQEQQALLISEPSLQPLSFSICLFCFVFDNGSCLELVKLLLNDDSSTTPG